MSEPFIGEVKIMSFNFPPKGWAQCNGALLPINQNQALFSVLGTMYGGDGRVTFGLPDLQGRVPFGTGGGLVIGQRGGEEAHTLNIGELPTHTHGVTASTTAAALGTPVGNFFATPSPNVYNSAMSTQMNQAGISPVGGSQPHENMSPYLVLQFCIALVGIFPSRN
jgi:microcystin-dependent protein